MKTLAALLLAAVLSICALAQEPTEQSAPAGQSGEATPADQSTPVNQNGQVPTYHVTVVSRTTKAINYRHRSGATKVDFRGTALMPTPPVMPKWIATRVTWKWMRTSRIWSRPARTVLNT